MSAKSSPQNVPPAETCPLRVKLSYPDKPTLGIVTSRLDVMPPVCQGWYYTSWNLQTTKTFVYDGFKQIAELTNNAVTMYTVWQPPTSGDFDVPLWTKTGTEVQTYITDGNKNIRQLKNAIGTVIANHDYDPFGLVTTTGTATPWQFSSEYRDAETGLVYYNYRYYDPKLGRWLKRDPIGEKGGVNLYVAINNNSIWNWDEIGFILAAVDGTSSAEYLATNPQTTTGRFRSHVFEFYYDTRDLIKRYWAGPAAWMTGRDATPISDDVHTWVCAMACQYRDQPIDLVGHSRGGFIVLTVARQLRDEGCTCGDGVYCNVPVRFLGLYDAVDMVLGYGRGENIPDNVRYAVHAMGHPILGSRPYFNTSDGRADDPNRTMYDQRLFWATHAAMGGAPWDGDHPHATSRRRDIYESIQVDMYVRENAINAGVDIPMKKEEDYGY